MQGLPGPKSSASSRNPRADPPAYKQPGLDFLDHGGAFWMLCPAGKIFNFGDAGHHYLFHEYGKKRSKFMWKALENTHPQFQPEFVPCSKTQAYANLLQMLKDNPPVDCTEPECELYRFRQQLSPTPESLFELVEFCLQSGYGI
jgi:hypothetical protein